MNKTRIILPGAVIALVALFFAFDLGAYLELAYIKEKQADLRLFHQQRPAATTAGYFLLYVAVTGLSLPGAAILTLAGGAVFGLALGVVIVSFASTIGATLAFLLSRYLLREYVQTRFADKLAAVNRGMEREGALYLFALRLVPAFPFFIINLVMGLTRMRVSTFFLVSQAGMLAGTIVYVNAGVQLGKIERLGDIASPALVLSFVLLGLFPLLARRLTNLLKKRAAGGKPGNRAGDA